MSHLELIIILIMSYNKKWSAKVEFKKSTLIHFIHSTRFFIQQNI